MFKVSLTVLPLIFFCNSSDSSHVDTANSFDIKLHLAPSARITLAEKRALPAPTFFSKIELLSLAVSELSKELTWFSPRFLDFPKTLCQTSGSNIEICIDADDMLQAVTARMKESDLQIEQFKADQSVTQLKMSVMKNNMTTTITCSVSRKSSPLLSKLSFSTTSRIR